MYTPIYKLDYKLRESPVHGEPRPCPAFQTSQPYRSSLRDDPLTVFGLEKKTSPVLFKEELHRARPSAMPSDAPRRKSRQFPALLHFTKLFLRLLQIG